jgi:single-strand DNA-binding protein
MASYNKVFLMGNLTRDPENRTTPSGLSITKIGLAVNRVYRTQDGEQKEEVTYVDCDAFGKTADTMAKYLAKGRPVFIEGRLRLDQWQDKNSGENRSKLGVVVDNFQFLGGREEGSGSGGSRSDYTDNSPPARTAPAATRTPPAPPQDAGIEEDDVPF